MPTDEDIDLLYELFGPKRKSEILPEEYGDGIALEEFHHRTQYPFISNY